MNEINFSKTKLLDRGRGGKGKGLRNQGGQEQGTPLVTSKQITTELCKQASLLLWLGAQELCPHLDISPQR